MRKTNGPPAQPAPSSNFPPARKRFGQNFLTNSRVTEKIIAALKPQSSETIVEIGPGRGVLTEMLLQQAGTVVAVEFDTQLIPFLEDRFRDQKNFCLVHDDALATDFCAAIKPSSQARLVANLPYNISTAILQRLIQQRQCLPEMVLMLQKEVVERITAPPGSTERGYLSVLVEAYFKTEKLFDVSPGSFRPVPKVWSSVLRLGIKPDLQFHESDEGRLWELVSAGFAQRRKTIFNNLRAASGQLQDRIKRNGGASIVLCRAEIELKKRAEQLSLEDWIRLAGMLD